MSLSCNLRVSKHLLWIRIAAKHLAPATPNEFFLIDPGLTPNLEF
jgi:hypothetical protein